MLQNEVEMGPSWPWGRISECVGSTRGRIPHLHMESPSNSNLEEGVTSKVLDEDSQAKFRKCQDPMKTMTVFMTIVATLWHIMRFMTYSLTTMTYSMTYMTYKS